MENISFEYKGVIFEAYKNLRSNGTPDDYVRTMRKCTKSDLTPEGYDHSEFYEMAKKHDACTDLYKVNGHICIPASTQIFYYNERN